MHIVFKIIIIILALGSFLTYGGTRFISNQVSDVYEERLQDSFSDSVNIELTEGTLYNFRVSIVAGLADDNFNLDWSLELFLDGELIKSFTDSKRLFVDTEDDDRRYNDAQFTAPASDVYQLEIDIVFSETFNGRVIVELNEDFAYFAVGSTVVTNRLLSLIAVGVFAVSVGILTLDRYLQRRSN